VVYGDIGTSPLYALRECFNGPHAVALTRANVLGVLSLIFWSLVIVISVKYLLLALRADNRGEGGILALMALARSARPGPRGDSSRIVVALGLFGAALLYGDGVITPAISVLSAVEGLEVATPALTPYVVPLTVAILIGLFLIQRRGTAGIGALFGPVMLVWFTALAILGVARIAAEAGVLAAVSPLHALDFFVRNRWEGFLVLGAVFLAVTGGEALYADMGHFGARPIRRAWFTLVLPALVINYFGQGALLLARPQAIANPFYGLVPPWGLYAFIALSTAATVIASQAVISGVFSLTRQAVQLGYCPRIRIEHTSPTEIGQIYTPGVNTALMLSTIAVVLGFRSSSNLAAAYGVAVTSTMGITTLLLYVVARRLWGWTLVSAVLVTAVLLAVDLAFLGANLVKVVGGGWFPLGIAGGVYVTMATWRRGRELLARRLREKMPPLDEFVADVVARPRQRVPGVAIFLSGHAGTAPPAFVHNLEHNKTLHETIVFITLVTEEVPHVATTERVEVRSLGDGFWVVTGHHGFMQQPNALEVLGRSRAHGLEVDTHQATFFLGRETVLATPRPGMARWREKFFSFMARNALRATAYFRIPAERVFEVGVQVEL
jgi:KUP system potassium uptake protein